MTEQPRARYSSAAESSSRAGEAPSAASSSGLPASDPACPPPTAPTPRPGSMAKSSASGACAPAPSRQQRDDGLAQRDARCAPPRPARQAVELRLDPARGQRSCAPAATSGRACRSACRFCRSRRAFTLASRSSASPSRTRKPCFVALPMAAMMAVGVASTSAQGQKTTRMVTARIISPVTSPG